MFEFLKSVAGTLTCAGLLSACPTAVVAEWHYEQQAIMGTEVHVQLWHEDSAQAQQIITEVMDEIRRLDNELSPYKESSELSRVNRAAGEKTLTISAELAQIIDKSLWYSEQTNGAFDITFATLGNLYDFRKNQQADQQTTDALLPALNYRHLLFNPEAPSLHFAHPATKIDLGGIAKGYAVDRAIKILQHHGVQNASVSAGGDARLLGDKRGKPWTIGIRHPRDKSKNAAILPLENIAISTSGDYERFFIDDDQQRVHHIFNPSTGKPADTDGASETKSNSHSNDDNTDKLISVTVLGPRGFDTDPLSTSVFVLGKEKGLALIEDMPGFDAIVINADHKLFFSSGLDR